MKTRCRILALCAVLALTPVPSASAVDWTVTPWGGFRCEAPGMLYVHTNYTESLFPTDWIDIRGKTRYLAAGVMMTIASSTPGSKETVLAFSWGTSSFGVHQDDKLSQYPYAWTGPVTIKVQLRDPIVVDNVASQRVYGTTVTTTADCTAAGSEYKARIDKAAADKAAAEAKVAADKAAAEAEKAAAEAKVAAAAKEIADKAAAEANRKDQLISVSPIPSQAVPLSSIGMPLTVTSNAMLSIFAYNNTNEVCEFSQGLVKTKTIGRCVIAFSQEGNSEFKPATNVILDFKIVSVAKKSTIICVKGKLTKTVTAVKPKCPTGYKKK